MKLPESYIERVKQRSFFQYIVGLLVRLLFFVRVMICRKWAVMKGAWIGEGSIISWKLAKQANHNLFVGEDCIINAKRLDLREKITIGSHVIINSDVEIIRVSHYIDDDHSFTTRPYPELIIEDYCWLATGTKILPQVTKISKGSVCGAYSVIIKNTEEMGVYGGNPAKLIKKRNTVHDKLLVCSLNGCDYPFYKTARHLY